MHRKGCVVIPCLREILILTEYVEASHPWLDLMLRLMRVVTVMDNLRRYPMLVKLAQCIPSNWTVGFRDQMIQYGKSKTAE